MGALFLNPESNDRAIHLDLRDFGCETTEMCENFSLVRNENFEVMLHLREREIVREFFSSLGTALRAVPSASVPGHHETTLLRENEEDTNQKSHSGASISTTGQFLCWMPRFLRARPYLTSLFLL